MGNTLSAPLAVLTGSYAALPAARDDLEKQSILVEGSGDWGSGIHRSPEAVEKLTCIDDPYVDTFYANFRHAVTRFPDNCCLGWRPMVDGVAGDYEFITFKTTGQWLTEIGSALVYLGIPHQANVGIYSRNRIEWVVVEHACYAYGYPNVAIYDTFGTSMAVYILNHAELPVVFVEKSKLSPLCEIVGADTPCLKVVVCFDSVEESDVAKLESKNIKLFSFDELRALGRVNLHDHRPPKSSDLAIIMYTSGTTGDPKGVLLTHANLIATINGAKKSVYINETDTYISYLPLAHCLERVCQAYVLHRGARIGFYQGDIRKLNSDLKALKPTVMIGVPRVYNRIYDTAMQVLSSSSRATQQLYRWAYAYKKAALERGQDTPWCDYFIFDKIRAAMGGETRVLVCGSAPLDGKVQEWMRVCVAKEMLQGYGLTETCAGSALQLPHDRAVDTPGGPLGCGEFKLVDVPELDYLTANDPPTGELWIRGTNVFAGYFKDPERTKEAVTEDGWLRTGDIGRWNPNGSLSIIDRKKNIFKLAQGEYIAAEQLEMIYIAAPHITQIYIHGDSLKPCLLAVVVPDPSVVDWALERGIKGDFESVCKHNDVKALLQEELNQEAKKAKLRGFEFIKGIVVFPELFSVENGMLTPTLKVKRTVAVKFFKEEFDKVYAELEKNGWK